MWRKLLGFWAFHVDFIVEKKKTAMYFMVIMVLIPLLIVFFDLLL